MGGARLARKLRGGDEGGHRSRRIGEATSQTTPAVVPAAVSCIAR